MDGGAVGDESYAKALRERLQSVQAEVEARAPEPLHEPVLWGFVISDRKEWEWRLSVAEAASASPRVL